MIPSTAPINVLILEDNPDDLDLLVRELKHGDLDFVSYGSASLDELKDQLSLHPWDLILSDFRLPGFTAFEALEICQRFDPDIPFIIVSGWIGEELAVSAMRSGAADVVMKDHLARLVPTVQRVIRDARSLRERRQMEQVQAALIRLSQVTMEAHSLDELYRTVHHIISSLMPAQNFYISIYDEQTEMVSFPYYIDEFDSMPPPEKLGRGITAYVLRTGTSLLASPEVFYQLVEQGEVVEEGAPSIDWLGVPLLYNNKPIGVLAVQSYTEGVRFTATDQKVLEFVSTQVGMAIHRKRAEEALQMESRFRKAIEDSILAGIIVLGLDGRKVYVNPAFCRMVGWEERELLGGKPPFVYWPPEEISSIDEAFSVVTSEDGLAGDFELRFMRKNGERFDAYLLLSPLTDEDGKLTGWLASVNDITSRKANEEAVRRQKSRAEALARTAARLSARLDLQAVLETVCEEICRAFNVQYSVFLLHDSERDVYTLGASYGIPIEQRRMFITPTRQNLLKSLEGPRGSARIPEIKEVDEYANWSLLNGLGVKSMLATAIAQAASPIGLLVALWSGEPRNFTDDEQSLIEGLGDLATQAITNARLFTEIERRLDQLHALHAVDLAISASMDLRITLNIILDHVIRLAQVDAADVLLFNPVTQDLEYSVGRGYQNGSPQKSRQRLRVGLAGKVVVGRVPILVQALGDSGTEVGVAGLADREKFVSYYGVPLIAKGQVKGVLEIVSRTAMRENNEWREMLDSLAGQAAIAIDNATLFDQLQRTNEELVSAYDSTLEGWIRAMELRDTLSSGHTQRVVDITLLLARKLGIREDEMIHIRRGALLHDVGNIGIPDSILQKQGKLSDDEWGIVRQHPVFAYQIISPIAYLRAAVDIPYCHHERWDGAGYPRQLKGEEIPLASRIFSVVDVWDALLSDRPYRTAWSPEDARRFIEMESGASFDPMVVKSFLRLV